jgi:DNA-binding MarR family transcriptional regulator/GNAT superfamily N-acetyltransferase
MNATDPEVLAVRRFNRFYTRQLGLLSEGFLESRYSLTEVRVLYELAHRRGPTASELRADLGLDRGYLSRLLARFRRQGLVAMKPSPRDARRRLLSLTARGRRVFAPLEARQRDQVASLLRPHPREGRARLIAAFETIEHVLGGAGKMDSPAVALRHHRPGDMGWVVHRHGVLYAQEHGWDERFEALVARVVSDFVDHFDPAHERCWIAERPGEILGSVFLVRKSKRVAQLRLLLVEPSARGLGIGRRLVQECVDFARRVGYRRITLWTQSNLHTARRLYERAGFRLVESAVHSSFGVTLTGETWVREL